MVKQTVDVKEFRELFDCLSYADYTVPSPKLLPARKTTPYTSKLRLKAAEVTPTMTSRRRDGKTSAHIRHPGEEIHYIMTRKGQRGKYCCRSL
jgi:hypothetical protein